MRSTSQPLIELDQFNASPCRDEAAGDDGVQPVWVTRDVGAKSIQNAGMSRSITPQAHGPISRSIDPAHHTPASRTSPRAWGAPPVRPATPPTTLTTTRQSPPSCRCPRGPLAPRPASASVYGPALLLGLLSSLLAAGGCPSCLGSIEIGWNASGLLLRDLN